MDDWVLTLLETNERVQRYVPNWFSVVENDQNVGSTTQGHGQHRNQVEFILYFYPHCFYSQKIMMVLTEKKCKFHEHLVNLNLGEQFHEEFLEKNPKGEVPVLLDKENHHYLIDSARISMYLEEKYQNDQTRCMIPLQTQLKHIHDKLYTKLQAINIEALTYGSVEFPMADLGIINPKYPYDKLKVRDQMTEVIQNRTALLRTEAKKIEHIIPEAHDAILQKVHLLHHDLQIVKEFDRYKDLLVQIESILQDCENQLKKQYLNNPDNWWLVTNFITLADVDLSILLFRLWQLGYEQRMWENGVRPYLEKYYNRMKSVPSFQKATGLDDMIKWPVYVAIGCLLIGIVGAGIYWINSKD